EPLWLQPTACFFPPQNLPPGRFPLSPAENPAGPPLFSCSTRKPAIVVLFKFGPRPPAPNTPLLCCFGSGEPFYRANVESEIYVRNAGCPSPNEPRVYDAIGTSIATTKPSESMSSVTSKWWCVPSLPSRMIIVASASIGWRASSIRPSSQYKRTRPVSAIGAFSWIQSVAARRRSPSAEHVVRVGLRARDQATFAPVERVPNIRPVENSPSRSVCVSQPNSAWL